MSGHLTMYIWETVVHGCVQVMANVTKERVCKLSYDLYGSVLILVNLKYTGNEDK